MPIAERYAGSKERAFVLVHGMPGNASSMQPLVSDLRPHGSVVLVDLPDCGTAPDATSDPNEAVEDVRTIIERLAPTPVTLVGLSFGGWLAGRLASQSPPANLARLAVLAGLTRLPAEARARYQALETELASDRMTLDALAEVFLNQCFPSGTDAATRSHILAEVRALPPARVNRVFRRCAELTRPENRVGPYEIPAVLLHGRSDAAVPLALGEELARLGRNSELIVLDTDAHYLSWSHTAESVRAALGV